jgi:hypothetical protein
MSAGKAAIFLVAALFIVWRLFGNCQISSALDYATTSANVASQNQFVLLWFRPGRQLCVMGTRLASRLIIRHK